MTLLLNLLALLVVGYVAVTGLLFLFQRSQIYFPTGRNPSVPVVELLRDDVRVQVSVAHTEQEQAVLYFGGNAEDVSQTLPRLARIYPQAAVYAMHYRGYGGSGGKPSERALVGDALALYDQVAVSHDRISVVGRSLGSAMAVRIAAERPVVGLVLVTPFDSLVTVAASHFRLFPVRQLLRDRYESWRHAERIRAPTTLVIAGADEIIPVHSSRRLADAFAPGVAEVVTIEGADHNSLSVAPEYAAALVRGVPTQ